MKKYLSLFFSFVFLFSIIISPLTSFAQISSPWSGDTDPDVEDSIPIESSCIDLKYNMQYRARDINTNGEVSLLQDFLQQEKYLNNEPTGYFGILTRQAVISFQKANNISPSEGYVGPITRAKIKALTCGDLSGPICDYANPPDNCEYVKGANYNSQTQCGLVLKCEDIKVCPAGTTGIYPNCTNILKPTITVSAPNGGESWNVGSTQKITWSSKYTTEGSWVALFLENSKNQTQLLAQKLPVNGSYSYLVSDFFCSGDICYPDKIDGYYKIIARVYNGTKDICGGLCPYDPKPESVLITEDKSDSVFKINTPYQSCPTGTTGIYPNCVTTVTSKPTITSYRSDMITTSERIVIPIMKWDSQNATSCVASSNPLNPSWSGPKSTSGQQEITNHKVITVLSLTCENASGSDSKSWTIYADGVKPALILTATPTSVSSGGSTQLSWFSTNAPNCIATANPSNTNWSGAKAVSSNQTLYNLQSNTTYTLTCSNQSGEKVSKSVDVGVYIVDDFKPSIVKTYPKGGETFNPGETIKVTWESKNLSNHLITAGLAFNKYESGYNPIKSTYKLYLPNTGETSITIPSVSELKALNIFSNSFHVDLYAEELKNGVYQNAVIDPVFKGFKINIPCDAGQTGTYPNCVTPQTPSVKLTANTTSIASGGSVTLTWTSTLMKQCQATSSPNHVNFSGSKFTNSSQTISNLTQNTKFTLTCVDDKALFYGDTGTLVSSVDVNVGLAPIAPKPTVTLTATPTSVSSGKDTTLSWSSTNATSCTANANPSNTNWSGSKPISGSQTTPYLWGTTQFTLTCVGAGGETKSTIEVGVLSQPIDAPKSVSINASQTLINGGGSVSLSWTTLGVSGCTASANPSNTQWSGSKGTSGNQTISNLTQNTIFTLSCGDVSSSREVKIVGGVSPTTSEFLFIDGCKSYEGFSTTTGKSCFKNDAGLSITPAFAVGYGGKLYYKLFNGNWYSFPNWTPQTLVVKDDYIKACNKYYSGATSAITYDLATVDGYSDLSVYKCIDAKHLAWRTSVLGASTEKNPNLCSLDSTLLKGMKSKEVKCLQQKLNQKGYKVVGTEGGKEHTQFGYYTMLALKKFQAENNLKADGILGIRTRELLNQ